MKKELFVGIDPSFTGTGLIILDSTANIIKQLLIKTKSSDSEEERLIQIEKDISFLSRLKKIKTVYLEGPSFSSSGAFVLQMGALHFLIRLFLYKKNIDYKIIAPGSLKKFITGKGTAKKELMLLNVYKKWGAEFDDNNLADAYSLARMALEENIHE